MNKTVTVSRVSSTFYIEHQIMICSTSSQNISILAGDGVRGSSFIQPVDISCENNHTFFVVDPASSCQTMITPTAGIIVGMN